MSNAIIVFFDVVLIANLFALALLLCADMTRLWRVITGFLMLISCIWLAILTVGDIAVWIEGMTGNKWFVERTWVAGWRASLGITFTAVNIAILSTHRGTKDRYGR